jgi:hypothetical protein
LDINSITIKTKKPYSYRIGFFSFSTLLFLIQTRFVNFYLLVKISIQRAK